MTVLVGVLCSDGVVIGSDSSATFGDGAGRSTIEQACQKTAVSGNVLLHAGTGHVGHHQRFANILEKKFKTGNPRNTLKDPIDFGKQVCREVLSDFASTQAPCGFSALLGYVGSSPRFGLIEFGGNNFQPEWKNEGMWFVAAGSGQSIADPFLGMIKGTLFEDQQPTLAEGILATCWTLQHAIALNTGGINGPVQIGVIAKNDEKDFFEAKMLTADDIAEHLDAVSALTAHIASYRKRLSGSGDFSSPPMPPAIDAVDVGP